MKIHIISILCLLSNAAFSCYFRRYRCPTCKVKLDSMAYINPNVACLKHSVGDKVASKGINVIALVMCNYCHFRLTFDIVYRFRATFKSEIMARNVDLERRCMKSEETPMEHNCAIKHFKRHMKVTCRCIGECLNVNFLPDTSKITNTCKLCHTIIRNWTKNECLNGGTKTKITYCKNACFIRILFTQEEMLSVERGCYVGTLYASTDNRQIEDLEFITQNGMYGIASGYCKANTLRSCNQEWALTNKVQIGDFMKSKSKYINKKFNTKKCAYCYSVRDIKEQPSKCEQGILNEIKQLTVCMTKCYTVASLRYNQVTIARGCSRPLGSKEYLDTKVKQTFQETKRVFGNSTLNAACIGKELCYKFCSNSSYCNQHETKNSIYNQLNRKYQSNNTNDSIVQQKKLDPNKKINLKHLPMEIILTENILEDKKEIIYNEQQKSKSNYTFIYLAAAAMLLFIVLVIKRKLYEKNSAMVKEEDQSHLHSSALNSYAVAKSSQNKSVISVK